MFEKLVATANTSDNGIEIHLRWSWRYHQGDAELPKCKIFCCMISESELLSDAVFGENEILDWINKNRIEIKCEDRRHNIEAYHRNPNNAENCVLRECQLQNGGHINTSQSLTFSQSHINKVFLVCVYGKESFEAMVLSPSSDNREISFSIHQPKGFDRWFRGNKSTKIILPRQGERRRAIISKYDNVEVFSIVPYDGDEFYLSDDVEPDMIKRVVYLSSLIG